MAVGLIAAALFSFGVTVCLGRQGAQGVPAQTKPEKTAARHSGSAPTSRSAVGSVKIAWNSAVNRSVFISSQAS